MPGSQAVHYALRPYHRLFFLAILSEDRPNSLRRLELVAALDEQGTAAIKSGRAFAAEEETCWWRAGAKEVLSDTRSKRISTDNGKSEWHFEGQILSVLSKRDELRQGMRLAWQQGVVRKAYRRQILIRHSSCNFPLTISIEHFSYWRTI